MSSRLMRDPAKGWVAGLFAGLCEHWGLNLFWCRVVFAVYLMIEPVSATLIYIVASLLMPKRRCRYY
ncbi:MULTISPECIES: PspC domain-containing protein [Ferrimonas]|uniref:Phage shock protein PspC (Stress-responsive transcriptional regulator) n=1 Tax=Ferrimonas sediminum TaxID=718193 RepID=A0A1G8MKI4_9GAMM|nr:MULTISPECIES: PspC domain-containing protein [Ferrimonas]USD37062.1 PspC domain-containing protein [Ferrimonas sp. SCSIO 43195]SDI67820.1 Phage shock protein PspC (stress-responsive transcriptional regulator) [Ferrimonas sediminum]